MRKLARLGLARCERGATAIEYALIVTLIVIVMIAALTSVANKTTAMWGNVTNAVTAH